MARPLAVLLLAALPALAAYKQVAEGGDFLLFLTTDGAVYGLGECEYGQLAQDNCKYARRPVPIPLPGPAKLIGAVQYTAFAVLESGQLYSWGSNSNGALGRAAGDPGRLRTVLSQPAPVPGLANVVQLATRQKTVAALTADGAVYAWGWQFNRETVNAPERVEGLPPIKAVAVGPGFDPGCVHTLALARDGALYAWGANNRGQLGIGSTQPANTPVKVNLPPVAAVAACMECSLAVLADGTVRAWGRDDSSIAATGQNVQAQHFPLPGPVPRVAGAVAIDAGQGHVGALLKDGSLRTWGHDGWGQSGSGTSGGYQPTPVTAKIKGVASLHYSAVAAYAITAAGRLWVWGALHYKTPGVLAADKHVPTEVPPLP